MPGVLTIHDSATDVHKKILNYSDERHAGLEKELLPFFGMGSDEFSNAMRRVEWFASKLLCAEVLMKKALSAALRHLVVDSRVGRLDLRWNIEVPANWAPGKIKSDVLRQLHTQGKTPYLTVEEHIDILSVSFAAAAAAATALETKAPLEHIALTLTHRDDAPLWASGGLQDRHPVPSHVRHLSLEAFVEASYQLYKAFKHHPHLSITGIGFLPTYDAPARKFKDFFEVFKEQRRLKKSTYPLEGHFQVQSPVCGTSLSLTLTQSIHIDRDPSAMAFISRCHAESLLVVKSVGDACVYPALRVSMLTAVSPAASVDSLIKDQVQVASSVYSDRIRHALHAKVGHHLQTSFHTDRCEQSNTGLNPALHVSLVNLATGHVHANPLIDLTLVRYQRLASYQLTCGRLVSTHPSRLPTSRNG
jgi:hypothetical protein